MILYKIRFCLILLVLFVNAISGYVVKNHPIRLLVDETEDSDQQLPIWIWVLFGVFAAVFVLFMIIGLIIWFCCYGRPNRISYVNEEQLIRAQNNQTDQSKRI